MSRVESGGFVPLVWPCLFGIGLYGLTTALLVVRESALAPTRFLADPEHDVDFFRTSRCRYMLTLIIGMLRESL